MLLRTYMLSAASAAKVSKTDSAYVNNTSIVTVVKYRGYTIVIHGDIEAEGLDALLLEAPGLASFVAESRDLFGRRAPGVDFLIAPHHGHPSGFSTFWFQITGPTRICNVVSERRLTHGEDRKKAEVDKRYSDAKFCLAQNREGRKMASTRADGTVSIVIDDEGKWTWNITA